MNEATTPVIPDFRCLLDAIPLPLAVLDSEFRFIALNPAFEARFDFQGSELVGRHFVDTIDPATAGTVRNNFEVMRDLDRPVLEAERKIFTRSGNSLDALLNISGFESDGERQYVVLYQDISAARARERLLFSRSEMFRLTIEQSPMPVSIQDQNWRLILVNHAYCDLTGYSELELLGRDPIDFLHPGEVRPDILRQRDAIKGSNLDELPRFSSLREIVHRDGRRIPYRLELGHSRGVDGAPLWCAMLIDLSRLEQAQSELEMQTVLAAHMRTRFDLFSASLDEAVVVLDATDGRVRYANDAVRAVFGVDPEIVRRGELQPLLATICADDRPLLQSAIDTLPGKSHTEAVVRVGQPGARSATVRVRMFGSTGPHAEHFMLAEDISRSVQQEHERLQAALAQRDTLVREVHHRIKNNLQGVSGLIRSTAVKHPELAHATDALADRVDAIAHVHGLQVRSGGTLEPEAIVRAIADNLAHYWSDPLHVEARRDAAGAQPQLPEQHAVPFALIVTEMLTNAFKHCAGAGPIELSMQIAPDAMLVRIVNPGTLERLVALEQVARSSTGLGLIGALMPSRGADFQLTQAGTTVIAALALEAPVIQIH